MRPSPGPAPRGGSAVADGADRFVIFLHIMKSGGMTLQRVLRSRYGPSVARRAIHFAGGVLRRGPAGAGGLESALRSRKPSDRYAAGHFCFGAHEVLPSPSTYITLLRRPLQRLVSLYHYSRETPDSFYHRHAVDRTLRSFLLKTELHELDNGQVRYLAGGDPEMFINRTPMGACTGELLERAKGNIDGWFSMAGTTERFDESMLLLRRALGWRTCRYLRRNEGTGGGARGALSEADADEVRRRNRFDEDLHAYVERRMDERIAALREEGVDFDAELRSFRSSNALYNRILRPPYDLYEACKLGAKRILGYRGSHPR